MGGVLKRINEYEDVAHQMVRHGYEFSNKIFVRIPNSREVLKSALKYFGKNELKWLPEYEKIADWLKDNQGRGLYMFGANGRGKTILGKTVIPAILLKYYRRVVSVYDTEQMNERLDEILNKRVICLDDIGTEDVRVNFGERRWAFPEIMDRAEKKGNLVIITSNLGAKAIEEKYGVRTIDRIKATCRRVVFDGESMRK